MVSGVARPSAARVRP